MTSSENAGICWKCPGGIQEKIFWEIPIYFMNEKVDFHCVTSSCFTAFNNKWRLALIRNPLEGRVGIFLWMLSSSNVKPNIAVKLGLLGHDDIWYKKCDGYLDLNGRFGSWNFASLDYFYSNKKNICPAGILKFACIMENKSVELKEADILHRFANLNGVDIKDSEDVKVDVSEENVKKENLEAKGVDRLIQNLGNLLHSGQNSDVILKVEDHEFRGHRGILTVRSPVFASMLQHDTKENATGIVDIPDCSVEAFQIFLSYIYTGSVDTISSDNVYNLYYTADKYQVNDLKSECVEFMENSLSVENFCETMVLSLQHNESGLQETATQFFCENVKTIIKTVQWQKYMKDYAVQANELYIKAINA